MLKIENEPTLAPLFMYDSEYDAVSKTTKVGLIPANRLANFMHFIGCQPISQCFRTCNGFLAKLSHWYARGYYIEWMKYGLSISNPHLRTMIVMIIPRKEGDYKTTPIYIIP